MSTHIQEPKDLRSDIMDAIHKGRINMRPRWHFILLSALTVLGVFIVLLTLLYGVSLAIFFLRDSGALFAPAFGARGWWALARSTPWLLIIFSVIFIGILHILVRHYRFVYGRPLFASILGIVMIVAAGGFAISQTRLHHNLAREARGGRLPFPVAAMYGGPMRMPRPEDAYHGAILNITRDGFIMLDEDDAGTTTVLITSRTRFPYGADFSTGERVIVVGDKVGTSTVQAFGIREIGE